MTSTTRMPPVPGRSDRTAIIPLAPAPEATGPTKLARRTFLSNASVAIGLGASATANAVAIASTRAAVPPVPDPIFPAIENWRRAATAHEAAVHAFDALEDQLPPGMLRTPWTPLPEFITRADLELSNEEWLKLPMRKCYNSDVVRRCLPEWIDQETEHRLVALAETHLNEQKAEIAEARSAIGLPAAEELKDKAGLDLDDAGMRLIKTPPVTLAGAAALLRLVAEFECEDRTALLPGLWDEDDDEHEDGVLPWAYWMATMLADALDAMAVQA